MRFFGGVLILMLIDVYRILGFILGPPSQI